MPKLKTSLFIDVAVWREIKKAAIDCGKTVSEFIEMLFVRWRGEQRADRDTANPSRRPKDW